jgi:hypothetical protein
MKKTGFTLQCRTMIGHDQNDAVQWNGGIMLTPAIDCTVQHLYRQMIVRCRSAPYNEFIRLILNIS